jgi:predicted ATPase
VIRKVTIRRFKRFDDVTFDLPGHVVVAGPNNTGKTTLLQAIAAFDLALGRWQELNDFQRHGGAYPKAPITRQAFAAVPLRSFELLWSERRQAQPIEIELELDLGLQLGMEFIADTTEQMFVRPLKRFRPEVLRGAGIGCVFVPAMSGLGVEEPVYQPPKIDQLLFQARPGEVLRNLLLQVSMQTGPWEALASSISELFGYILLPPDGRGANILAEYCMREGGPRLDIASAGSGFLQVLMLLTFLHTRPGSVLLLDEPDAHLHVILQDAIYAELRRVAAEKGSQLVIATHSEVVINAAEPRNVCVLLDRPRMLADNEERAVLIRSLKALTNEDVMRAIDAPGVLYVDDYTDLDVLREWARVSGHPAHDLLTMRLFWKPNVAEPHAGVGGVPAQRHHEALCLVRADLPALQILDGDDRPEIPETAISGRGFQRVRWRRYEIESYLFHPSALERFVSATVGQASAEEHVAALREHLSQTHPPAFLRDPLADHAFLAGVKARKLLLPPALTAAGLPGFPYQRYFEIAAQMLPAEIHPEVIEKLDAIVKAFGQ